MNSNVHLSTSQLRLRHLQSVTFHNLSLKTPHMCQLRLRISSPTVQDDSALTEILRSRSGLDVRWDDLYLEDLPFVALAADCVRVELLLAPDRKTDSGAQAEDSAFAAFLEYILFFSSLVHHNEPDGEDYQTDLNNHESNLISLQLNSLRFLPPSVADMYSYSGSPTSSCISLNVSDRCPASYTVSCLLSLLIRHSCCRSTKEQRSSFIGYLTAALPATSSRVDSKQFLLQRLRLLRSKLKYDTNHLMRSKQAALFGQQTNNERESIYFSSILSFRDQRLKLLDDVTCYESMKVVFLNLNSSLSARQGEMLRELLNIFPITDNAATGLSINSICLPPQKKFHKHKDSSIAHAVGNAVQLTLVISKMINVSLRYPLIFRSSKSICCDPISSDLPEAKRIFPLFGRSRDKSEFEYGVFLLNSDIAQLRKAWRLPTARLQDTLANLRGILNPQATRLHFVFLPNQSALEQTDSLSSFDSSSSENIPSSLACPTSNKPLECVRAVTDLHVGSDDNSNRMSLRPLIYTKPSVDSGSSSLTEHVHLETHDALSWIPPDFSGSIN